MTDQVKRPTQEWPELAGSDKRTHRIAPVPQSAAQHKGRKDGGNQQMITRIWHGWTTAENADAYEELLRSNLFPKIADCQIEGYEGAHLLRRDSNEGVEFITLLWFETFEAVKAFAREASRLAEARQLLVTSDRMPQHYRVIPPDEQ